MQLSARIPSAFYLRFSMRVVHSDLSFMMVERMVSLAVRTRWIFWYSYWSCFILSNFAWIVVTLLALTTRFWYMFFWLVRILDSFTMLSSAKMLRESIVIRTEMNSSNLLVTWLNRHSSISSKWVVILSWAYSSFFFELTNTLKSIMVSEESSLK